MKRDTNALVMFSGLLIALCSLFRIAIAEKDPQRESAHLDMPKSDNWPNYGRTPDEDHYSPLADINTSNVSRLRLAWWFDIPGIVLAESVPLEVDGTLYFTAGYSVVRAVDAVTGHLLWVYDPKVPAAAGHKLRLLWGIRGIAYWNNRIYAGTHDGRLISIDAKTGKLIWSVTTNEPGDSRIITGPPRLCDGKVIIGHAAGEWGEFEKFAAVRGYVTAYDAKTGKRLWRFFTVPGDPSKGFEDKAMEMAAKTWDGEWWKYGGGGTVWNGITCDPELRRIYIGTSNGFPMDAAVRSPGGGDNLFLASIVALDASSGAYLWHYQTNPSETWDYDATEDIELANLMIDGAPRRVLMQASKNGFFYVIDRDAGKLLSVDKFAKVTWADRIDLETGRPVETPFARDRSAAARVWPTGDGAHGWASMAFNPTTRLAYFPVLDSSPECKDTHGDARGKACYGASSLLAWDPIQHRAAWRVPLTGVRSGGAATTAGKLVFQGASDGKFAAYAADSGKELWSFNAQVGIAGAPITYGVAGRQYVSVMAGYGGGGAVLDPRWDARTQPRRVLTFALDGGAQLTAMPARHELVPLVDPQFKAESGIEKNGAKNFAEHCSMCHGFDAIAGGQAPDLRASPIILSEKAFSDVVKQGMLRARGMPRFEELSDGELGGIRQYLRSRARDLSAKRAR